MDTTNATVIGNAQMIIDEISALGLLYNPSEARYKIPALQLKKNEAFTAEENVTNQLGIYDPFRKAREVVFTPVDNVCLGAKGIFNGSGTTKAEQARLMAAYRKLCGIRKVAKVIAVPPAIQQKYNSVSQQEFDSKIINFLAIIVILENNPKYLPNEVEYKTVTLRATYADMILKNTAAKNASVPYHTAVNVRDRLLYQDELGLCDTYNHGVKEYCKGILRTNKAAYNRIKKIMLKKRVYEQPPL